MCTSSGMAIETADFTLAVVESGMFTMNTHDGPTGVKWKDPLCRGSVVSEVIRLHSYLFH